MPRRRRVLRVLAVLVGLVVVGVGALALALRHALPSGGVAGADADAAAHAVEASVDLADWNRTMAVRWTFNPPGKKVEHLWDRARSFDRVRWGGVEVLLDIARKDGKAWKDGVPVEGEARAALVDKAWGFWINDSFWLNPLAKLFDDGVTQSLVTIEDGRRGLLVSYASGGKTPGDTYLWLTGSDGRPSAWRLYVSIIPVGGLEIGWSGWATLSTGARIATEHHGALFTIHLRDVAGARTLAELEPGADPFAVLAAANVR